MIGGSLMRGRVTAYSGRKGVLSLQPYFIHLGATDMATKKSSSTVYRVTEIIGTSPVSWEEAARTAVETASKTLRDLRVAEIVKLDMKVENGKAVAFRARVALSFKYEG
jgi:flavin-binding protein dodecin